MTETTPQHCTIRPMTSADWPAVEASFMHSFIAHRTPQVWAWRYQQHLPDQTGWRGWVNQAPDGTIAAFIGASVHRCWIQGHEKPLLIGRDNHSHPAWRYRTHLAKKSALIATEQAFHASSANEAAISIGIGNNRRVQLGVLLGACTAYTRGQWWRLALPTLQRTDSGYTVEVSPTHFTEETWNNLWSIYQKRLTIGLVRDQKFLHWRFDDRQGQAYWRFAFWSIASSAPVGFAVVTPVGAGQAILVDLILPEQHQAVRDAFVQIACWLQERGIQQLDTFLGHACPAQPWLPLLGFSPIAPPLPVQAAYRCYTALPEEIDFDSAYAMTLADSDLY